MFYQCSGIFFCACAKMFLYHFQLSDYKMFLFSLKLVLMGGGGTFLLLMLCCCLYILFVSIFGLFLCFTFIPVNNESKTGCSVFVTALQTLLSDPDAEE